MTDMTLPGGRFGGTTPRKTEGSLSIEAKLLEATPTKPARVKAKVLGGTAELILPRAGFRSLDMDLRRTAEALAVALKRDPSLVLVAPTKDGWLYRAYMPDPEPVRDEAWT